MRECDQPSEDSVAVVRPAQRTVGLLLVAFFCVCHVGILPCQVTAWSIDTHPMVAEAAVGILPGQWRQFFEYYEPFLAEATAYPDTYYRESDPDEGSRHYIDLEIWNVDDPPTGTLPQAVDQSTVEMESAIRARDWNSALLDAGRIAHYMADATQPYHTTLYYDPQTKNGAGAHQLFESMAATHLSDCRLVSSTDAGAIEPVANVTTFVLETVTQSHSFLVPINRTLIDEGLGWSPELTQILEVTINTAIVATARIWYTAIVRSGSLPPELPRVNKLSIMVESMTGSTTSYGVIRLRVVDSLGIRTRADVSLTADGSTFRGQVANVVPPIGEYVIILPPGTYSSLVVAARREGFESATVTIASPASPIPTSTLVALVVMFAALLALVWYRRRPSYIVSGDLTDS